MKKHRSWQTGVSLVWLFLMSSAGFDLAWAQEPVGVVTALQGTAQLTRPATPTPVVLRFKDGLLLRDIIDTQEKSLARVLFGGKSTVTVKELSRLEVREEVLPTGATRAVHELSSGAILVNVARELMRPGDEVQIRTPNTVAAVRGTTVIAQFIPALSQSILTVLAGTASVTPLGLPPLTLAPNTATTITGIQATGVQAGPVQTVTAAQATQILQSYQVGPAVKEEASQQQTGQGQMQTATTLATAVVETITGAPVAPPTTVVATASVTTTATTTAPLTQDVSTASKQAAAADLGISVTASSASVPVGGNLTYTVVASNKGPDPATGVTLTVPLPTGVTFVSATTPQGSCSGTATVTCTLGTLSTGASVTVALAVRPTAPGNIGVQATVQGTEEDPITTNNTAPVTVAVAPVVVPTTDLRLAVTASSASVPVGGNLTYTIVVTNTGPDSATNVALPIPSLPSGVTLISATSTQGSCSATTCNLGTIATGASATVTLVVRPTAPGSISVQPTVQGTETDPLPANNTASVTTTVTPATMVTITGVSTSTAPLLQVTGSLTLSASENLAQVPSGQTASIAGPVLQATDATLRLGANALLLGGTLTSTTTAPLFKIDPTTLTIDGNLVLVQAGGTLSLAGLLLDLTNSILTTTARPLVLVETGGSLSATTTGTTPFINLNASTLTSAQSLLDLKNSTLTLGGAVAKLSNTSTLENKAGPVIKITGGSLTADALIATDGLGNTLKLAGTLLDLSNTTVTLVRALVDSPGTDRRPRTVATGEPLIRMSSSTLTLPSGLALGAQTGPVPDEQGVALIATGTSTSKSTLNLKDSLLNLNAVNSDATTSLIQLNNTTLSQSGTTAPLIRVDSRGLASSMGGQLLSASDSTITSLNHLVLVERSSLTTRNTQPLIQVATSTVKVGGIDPLTNSQTFGSLLTVSAASGGPDAFAIISIEGLPLKEGPLFKATGSTLTATGDTFAVVNGATLTSNAPAPLVQLDSTSLAAGTAGRSLFNVSGTGGPDGTIPPFMGMRGPLFSAVANSTLTVGREAILVGNSGLLISIATAPLLQVSASKLTTETDFVNLTNGGLLVTGGSLLQVADGGTVTTTKGAFISASSGGLVLIPGAGVEFGAGTNAVQINNATAPTATPNGVPLSVTNNAVVALGPNSGLSSLTVQSGGSAIVASDRGTLVTINPVLLPAGPVLAIANDTLSLGTDPLASFGTGASASIDPGPPLTVTAVQGQGIAQLAGPVIDITDADVFSKTTFITLSGTSLAIPGPLLQLTNTILDNSAGGGDLLFVEVGSLLKSFGLTPLILIDLSVVRASTLLFIDGGTVDLGDASLLSAIDSDLAFDFALLESEGGGLLKSTSPDPLVTLSGGTLTSFGHLLLLGGSTIDPATGLGTERPLLAGGILLKATDAASIAIGGSALRLDTALLEATAPVINLLGSATQATSLTTGSSTLDLFKSKVTSTGPVVALDKGLITVKTGPLINLTQGSTWVVTGDLLSLISGSKINVLNGPLIRADGVAPTGTSPAASTLSVSGALVNFGGTGGNQIIVTNTIAPTATQSGLPVSATAGGTISIGPNPIKNPSLGSVTVSSGGSLIQATNGGTVKIAAP